MRFLESALRVAKGVAFGLLIIIASFTVIVVACKATYEPFTQPSPTSANEEYMLSELERFTPMLNMGRFIGTFAEPPNNTYAGWADCQVSGRKPPWYVHFNRNFVNDEPWLSKAADIRGLTNKAYMSALVAHEMCHHWVAQHSGQCYDEVAAETCAFHIVAEGSPQ